MTKKKASIDMSLIQVDNEEKKPAILNTSLKRDMDAKEKNRQKKTLSLSEEVRHILEARRFHEKLEFSDTVEEAVLQVFGEKYGQK